MAVTKDWAKLLGAMAEGGVRGDALTKALLDPSIAEKIFNEPFVIEQKPRLDQKKWSMSEAVPFHRALEEKGVMKEVMDGIAIDLHKKINKQIHPGCIDCGNRRDVHEVMESMNDMGKRVAFVSSCKRPQCIETVVHEPDPIGIGTKHSREGAIAPIKTQSYADYRVANGLVSTSDLSSDERASKEVLQMQARKQMEAKIAKEVERKRREEEQRKKEEHEQLEYIATADVRGEW